ncbi:uncharacterized protein FIBRA_03808 [Fibroporia radiculosa]|uniref:Spindle pole body component n=1 Tax=Fibroporia radiculosa TaxID=599839 RepID=J4HW69_9APHY|nr:uncharacterized protein FIBRA_03808 [Fibroporia radiculosa]CCM01742.1 predicted protein [Fibroporia radiculosa]
MSGSSKKFYGGQTNAPPLGATLSVSSSAPILSSSQESLHPNSNASIRPSTSAPLRPASALSSRTFSVVGSYRPPSSASTRPGSRLAQRPASRVSQRPISRQSTRLLPSYQTLVTQVAGLAPNNDEENFRVAVDFVSKTLDQTARPSGTNDISVVDKHLRGHAQKACINSHDVLAEALEIAHRKVKAQMQQSRDLDSDIKTSLLPSHLQLLILLSLPPDAGTQNFAEEYINRVKNPSQSVPTLTWKDILAEEPFEGQHWEGAYGLLPGSTVEDWYVHSGGSTPSLSPFDDDSDDLDVSLLSAEMLDDRETLPSPHMLKMEVPVPPRQTYSHRQDVEDLQAKQYWRTDWHTDANIMRPFNIGDASTLGPSIHRALGDKATLGIDGPQREKYIHEHDAVREVLMGLRGHKNLMMAWLRGSDGTYSFVSTLGTRLLHFSAMAQASILTLFAETATTLEHLRKFIKAVYCKASSRVAPDNHKAAPLTTLYRHNTLTLEAFSAAVESQILALEGWCALKEEQICMAESGVGPTLVVSLLSLEKSLRDKFSLSFPVVLDVLRNVVQRALRLPEPLHEIWTMTELPMRSSPSVFSALLLDSLLNAAQENVSLGDAITSATLMRIFVGTAEPIWNMVGRWLRDGMPVQNVLGSHEKSRAEDVDDEFFVGDNELPILDPDFWADGFTLKDGQGENTKPSSIPTFLEHMAQDIMHAGKAIGLLRLLGIPAMFDRQANQSWMADWRSFAMLLNTPSGSVRSQPLNSAEITVQGWSITTSTGDLSRLISDELAPHILYAQEMLQKVLIDDCDLWLHLSAMEDLFLMRRGDAMSHFIDKVLLRMDSRQPWTDFHFLNTAFRDVAEATPHQWIDTSLVRFSHRGAKDKSITRTVRAIDGLLIEYAVPFPLTYVFGPRVMQVYSSIFSFILQIRRAKSVLERILVRGDVAGTSHLGSDLKAFYAMRSKLSWFVNVLLNFLATNVLHTQVLQFHEAFKKANSLNEMIRIHDEHLLKIQGRCLLQRNTSAFHRAIISILDLTMHFSDCFVAFAGDTTHDISRNSIVMMKRHRSRRVRRQKRNVIGFTQSLRETDESSESDRDEEFVDGARPEPSFSLATSTGSFVDESFIDRLDKMSSELDTLVRFIRHGAESLAAGGSEAASAFGIFAFALEDWDR